MKRNEMSRAQQIAHDGAIGAAIWMFLHTRLFKILLGLFCLLMIISVIFSALTSLFGVNVGYSPVTVNEATFVNMGDRKFATVKFTNTGPSVSMIGFSCNYLEIYDLAGARAGETDTRTYEITDEAYADDESTTTRSCKGSIFSYEKGEPNSRVISEEQNHRVDLNNLKPRPGYDF